MLKSPRLLAALTLALALFFGFPAHAQDSPSLGDLARQAQKDKEKDKAAKPAAKVITNDDMPSGGGAAGAFGSGFAPSPQGGGQAPGSANASPAEKLAQLEKIVDAVEVLDKATLVNTALKEKSDVNFPGRAAWEQRLMSARDTYVVQLRIVLQKAREIAASADSLKGNKDPNDPRLKEMNARLQDLIRDAVQTDARMQAVIMEGRDLASQPVAH